MPQVVGTVDESYDPTGKLEVSWQVVGTSRNCSVEPPAFVESLASSTHPSGNVITAVDELVVNGMRVAVYVTAPATQGTHGYQYFTADATFGSSCIELGGAEYGVASEANLQAMLGVLGTTHLVSYPAMP